MTHAPKSDSGEYIDSFFLATTALDEFWDKSAKVVFLGEWCRRYSKAAVWRGLDAEIILDLWGDPQRRADAYRQINELYEAVLPRLGARLNEVHGTSHGNQYWRLVIGNWLYFYISTLFDRHAHLVCAIEQYPAIKTVVLSDECHITPKNSLDVMCWNMTDSYNFQIYSCILGALGWGDFPQVKIRQKLPTGRTRRGGVRARLYAVARRFLTRLLAQVGRGRVILHRSYFSRCVEFLLAARSGWMVLPSFFLDESTPPVEIDLKMRKHLMDDFPQSDETFEAVLAKLLPYDIPQCFVEGYCLVAEQARMFPVAPRAIFSSSGWAFDEAFKQWAGTCAERGTMLLSSQHGGGYTGIGTYSPYEGFEISIADRYYSWGWRPEGKYRDKVKPMPAAYLTGRKKIPADNRKTGILYLATADSRYMYSLQDTSGYYTTYVQWQARFMDALSPPLRESLRVRLHPWDCGWDFRDRWQDYSSEIVFEDTSRPFLESLKNCRIYIYAIIWEQLFMKPW